MNEASDHYANLRTPPSAATKRGLSLVRHKSLYVLGCSALRLMGLTFVVAPMVSLCSLYG